jgi:hypothetical protein
MRRRAFFSRSDMLVFIVFGLFLGLISIPGKSRYRLGMAALTSG